MKVLATAPGKVILFGEHGVVYGKPAIAVAINLRTYGLFESTGDTKIRLKLPDIGVDVEWDAKELDRAVEGTEETDKISPIPTDLQARLEALVPEHLRSANQMHATLAFLYLRARLAPRGSGMNVVIRSALPVGAGLGSSASYAVVLSSGLLRIYKGAGRPVEEVNGWAFMAEKVIHGNPSGLDNTLCTYGGAKLYSRLNPTPIDIPGFHALTFLITNTRVPKNTMKQVADVRTRRDLYPTIMDPLIDAVGKVSETCKALFDAQHEDAEIQKALSFLIDANHGLLVAMGTSHASLEKVREVTARVGLSSKLTGGGGGGCAITLVRDDVAEADIQRAESELQSQGYDCFRTSVGCPGHSVHLADSITSSDIESLDLEKLEKAASAVNGH